MLIPKKIKQLAPKRQRTEHDRRKKKKKQNYTSEVKIKMLEYVFR